MLLLCGACTVRAGDSDSIAESPDAKPKFGVFTNPQPVTIEGYSQDAMEPFISPDGNYLFFNNSNSLPTTNLYYATRIDDVTFQFVGEIAGANGGPLTLTAVPSMDINNTFYFISNRSYAQTFSTIYSGIFSNGSLSNVALVPGVSKEKLGDVNFDQCISPDGNTLYFVDGVFTGGQQVRRRRDHRDREAQRQSVHATQEQRQDHAQDQHPRPELRARCVEVGTRVLLDSDSDSRFAA